MRIKFNQVKCDNLTYSAAAADSSCTYECDMVCPYEEGSPCRDCDEGCRANDTCGKWSSYITEKELKSNIRVRFIQTANIRGLAIDKGEEFDARIDRDYLMIFICGGATLKVSIDEINGVLEVVE